MEKIQNYIGGELIGPAGGNYFENFEPATGGVYSMIPDSDQRDIDLAVKKAEAAFSVWSTMPVEKRSAIMIKIADAIEKNLDDLAMAESRDNGKPLWLARRVDIPRASKNFRFFGTSIIHFSSESHSMSDSAINYTLRLPIGVVGCISPWNLPLYLFTWKIAPALAAGNCVVAKPSEITPMSAFRLSQICMENGLPAGVLNIVHGYGSKVGAAISAHPGITAISFTGGTKTGAAIAEKAAPMFKKLSLELGGKNPNIIFADCDFEKALSRTVDSSFENQGQICLCGSRIFVEKKIYERFRDEFVKRVKKLKVGDPMDDSSNLGAVVSRSHMEKILSYIKLAGEEGGTILTGGKRVEMKGRNSEGWFLEPTVIEGLAYNCRTNMEEIFGPVVTIMPFETEEEVVKFANATEYGLAATIWTENLTRAHRLAQEVRCGIIWINCWLVRDLRTPFGGMKSSGVGREGGEEALRFFTEAKNVCISLR